MTDNPAAQPTETKRKGSVDVWVTDRGNTWCFKPVSDEGESYCHEYLGTLSDAQRQGEFYCVTIDGVIGLVRHMTHKGLHVKEVMH